MINRRKTVVMRLIAVVILTALIAGFENRCPIVSALHTANLMYPR